MHNQTQEIPQDVRDYLEGILKDANMLSLDDDMKEEMVKELYARLDNYITSVLVDTMPPDQLEPFIKMNEDKKPKAEIETFVKQHLPNAQEVFTKAFVGFRDMYLGNVAVKRNAPPEEKADTSSQAN